MPPNFDPPSDPYGDEHNCRLCDQPMQYDPWEKVYYCNNEQCPYPPEEMEADHD